MRRFVWNRFGAQSSSPFRERRTNATIIGRFLEVASGSSQTSQKNAQPKQQIIEKVFPVTPRLIADQLKSPQSFLEISSICGSLKTL